MDNHFVSYAKVNLEDDGRLDLAWVSTTQATGTQSVVSKYVSRPPVRRLVLLFPMKKVLSIQPIPFDYPTGIYLPIGFPSPDSLFCAPCL